MFAAFFEMIGIGTLGFWIMVSIVSCFMVGFIEFRKSGWATITFIGTLVLLYYVKGLNFTWIAQNALILLIYVSVYIFVVGAGWAVFKWWRMVKDLADKCKELKYEFCRVNRISNGIITEDKISAWRNCIADFKSSYKSRGLVVSSSGIVPPHPNDFKEEIYIWLFFWPWSMLWFLVDVPVRRLGRFIYRNIRSSLVTISERSFKDIKDDFATPSERERSHRDFR